MVKGPVIINKWHLFGFVFNVYGEIDSVDYDFEKNYFLENGSDWNDYGEEREEEYYDAYYRCKDEM